MFTLRRRSQVMQNAAVGTFSTGWNVVVSLVSYPLFLHYLGYEYYGVWLLLATAVNLAQFGSLGFGQALAKLVAEGDGKHSAEEISQYFSTTMTALTGSGFLVIVILLMSRNPILNALHLPAQYLPLASHYFALAVLLSVYVFLVDIINQTLVGFGRLDRSIYAQTISQTAGTILSMLAVIRGGGIGALLIGAGFTQFALHLISFWQVRNIWRARFPGHPSLFSPSRVTRKAFLRLLKQGGGMMTGSLFAVFLAPFNRIMLSRYGGLQSVTVFDIAYVSTQRIRSFLDAGARALMPEVSRLGAISSSQSHSEIARLIRKGFLLLTVFTIPCAFTLVIAAKFILKIWLGARFLPAMVPAFQICVAGVAISSLALPGFYALCGLGKVYEVIVSNIILAGLNVTAQVLLVLAGYKLNATLLSATTVLGLVTANLYLLFRTRTLFRPIPGRKQKLLISEVMEPK